MHKLITIDKRFCGPPKSGNGGYVSGLLAKNFAPNCEVKLRVPPPLNTEMTLHTSSDEATLSLGDTIVATAKAIEARPLSPPDRPSIAEAEAAQQRFTGFVEHSLPTCFVCGPQRKAGDGLHIFPGKISEESNTVASVWQLDKTLCDTNGDVAPEYLWAALDCPGYFAIEARAGFALLGAFSAQLLSPIHHSMEQVVSIGWPLGSEGRKHRAGTALISSAGVVLAVAQATWISVPKDAFVEATN